MEDQKLTIKQRKWLAIYITTGNATEAAMQAYDCKDRDSARALGSENLAKLNITEYMEAAGISFNRILGKLNKGLDATKVVSARVTGKNADSQTDDFIDVDDYPTQHKYMETALKLRGYLNPKLDAKVDGVLEVIIKRKP